MNNQLQTGAATAPRAAAPLPSALLAELQPGQQARIAGLAPECKGAERRRLLDLGFVPGTLVVAEMHSPTGDLTAYRVRGTLIALRREQSHMVGITPPVEHEIAQ